MASSRTFATVLAVIALCGFFAAKNTGLESLGRKGSVRCMYVRKVETGSSFGIDAGGTFTVKPSLCRSFLIPKKLDLQLAIL